MLSPFWGVHTTVYGRHYGNPAGTGVTESGTIINAGFVVTETQPE